MEEQSDKLKRIFLVGMPGSGKSTTGRLLAEKLGMEFIDLDLKIVEKEQQSINRIFEEKGEGYFREVESAILGELLNTKNQFVMSTGGGTPCFFDQMSLLNNQGITLYLKADVNQLLARTSRNTKRPLLIEDPAKRMQELMIDREPVYQRAKYLVQIKSLTTMEITQKIIELISG